MRSHTGSTINSCQEIVPLQPDSILTSISADTLMPGLRKLFSGRLISIRYAHRYPYLLHSDTANGEQMLWLHATEWQKRCLESCFGENCCCWGEKEADKSWIGACHDLYYDLLSTMIDNDNDERTSASLSSSILFCSSFGRLCLCLRPRS
jgi:hypothetical protein